MTQQIRQVGFKKNGSLESRKNAKVYVTDLLDCRRQRLNDLWYKRLIPQCDFEREINEILHAVGVINKKL